MSSQGYINLPATLALSRNALLADVIASIVNPLINGDAAPLVKLGANSLVFGSSRETSFDFLSQVALDTTVDPSTLTSGGDLPAIPESLLSEVKVSTTVDGLGISAEINLASVGIESASFKFGYLDLGVDVEKEGEAYHLASLYARDTDTSGCTVSLPISVNIANHDPRLPEMIASLVDMVIYKGQPIPAGFLHLVGSGLYFGKDQTNRFNFLSKIIVSIDPLTLIPSLDFDSEMGLAELPVDISSVTGKMRDDLVLGVDVAMRLKAALPIPLSLNLDFAGLELWVGNSLVTLPPRDGSYFPGIYSVLDLFPQTLRNPILLPRQYQRLHPSMGVYRYTLILPL
jgi:hypothetical protein